MDDYTVLQAIWSRSVGTHVFLPRLLEGVWHEGQGIEPDSPIMMLPDFAVPGDHYFSPLRYEGSRRKAFLGVPGVIFADLDDGVDKFPLPPSVLVISSRGHGHGYWFLDQPYPVEDWEPRAKGWTLELGADPGGWDATQVLRVPGTLNNKHPDQPLVYVQQFAPERIYTLDQFPEAEIIRSQPTTNYPIPDLETRNNILKTDSRIGLSTRYWLSVTEDELKPLGKIDRSAIMWETECKLLEAGFTDLEVFDLLHFSAINKWKTVPHKLWLEIGKAAAHSLSPA